VSGCNPSPPFGLQVGLKLSDGDGWGCYWAVGIKLCSRGCQALIGHAIRVDNDQVLRLENDDALGVSGPVLHTQRQSISVGNQLRTLASTNQIRRVVASIG